MKKDGSTPRNTGRGKNVVAVASAENVCVQDNGARKRPVTAISVRPRPSAAERKERGRIIAGLLKKHNAIIHIEGNMTLLDRRLYNVLLLNAYDDLERERTHAIPVWYLCESLGYESNNIMHLAQSIKRLQSSILEINLLKDGKRVWEAMTLLSYAKIENGICVYRYDEAIAERLHAPEVYTSINLSVQNEFSSSYALALYENCVRFRSVGRTGMWEVELLRMLMGAHQDKSYSSFKHFNYKCLKGAIKEINERSDISVEPVFEKEGHFIARVGFKVSKSTQRSLYAGDIDDPHTQIRQGSLYMKLRGAGLSDPVAIMYAHHQPERAQDALHHLDLENCRQPGRIRSRAAYLRAIIDSGVDIQNNAGEVEDAARRIISETTRLRQESDLDTMKAAEASRRFNQSLEKLSAEDIKRFAEQFAVDRNKDVDVGEDGYPKDHADRSIFRIWLRGQIGLSLAGAAGGAGSTS